MAAELLPPEQVKVRSESVRAKRVITKPTAPLFSNPRADETEVKQSQTERRFSVSLELSEEEMQLIEQAKKILSTSKVKATLLGATKKLIQRAQRVERVREKRRAKKAEDELNATRGSMRNFNSNIEQEEVLTTMSRYIPADVRHQVEQRFYTWGATVGHNITQGGLGTGGGSGSFGYNAEGELVSILALVTSGSPSYGFASYGVHLSDPLIADWWNMTLPPAVPAPGSALLLGLGGIFAARRRR